MNRKSLLTFRSFEYRVSPDEYFYPASTVKLPTALLALEKINALDIAGLDRDTTMLTGAEGPVQTPVLSDVSSPTGLPSAAHYIRKILLVRDNDAFNRLYEFIGQQSLNEAMHRKGYSGTRIMHRLEIALSIEENQLVYESMSMHPGESGIAAYGDAERYPSGYVKFLMYGGDATEIPDNIRIFNKVGDAYGFLTDAAYVVDLENGVEFILAATIYTNANETFNDNNYEYDEIGLPFLRELGQAIYELELARDLEFRPDLSRFLRSE